VSHSGAALAFVIVGRPSEPMHGATGLSVQSSHRATELVHRLSTPVRSVSASMARSVATVDACPAASGGYRLMVDAVLSLAPRGYAGPDKQQSQ
jgi:hypothetical protein